VRSAPVPEYQEAQLDPAAWQREWARATSAGRVLPGTELRLQGQGLPRPARSRRPDTCVPDRLRYRLAPPRCRVVSSGPRGAPAGAVAGAPDLLAEVRRPGTEDDPREQRRAHAPPDGRSLPPPRCRNAPGCLGGRG
jgi:hypothetical protein